MVPLTLFASLAACSSPEHEVDYKDALRTGKADLAERICGNLGLAADCDVCAELGYYDDGVCDDFCASPDPTCPLGPPAPPADVIADFDFVDSEQVGATLFLLDNANNQVRRYDAASKQFLAPLAGIGDVVAMAVAPAGDAVYLSYAGGRIDVFDTATGTGAFFAATATTTSAMVVAGDRLFTVDGYGTWGDHTLFDRATGTRLATRDWSYYARDMVYSADQNAVYYLHGAVSPTDISKVQLDTPTGVLGPDEDSPYHGDYEMPGPLHLSPDGSGVLVGSGLIFSVWDLTYQRNMWHRFVDIAFGASESYLLQRTGDSWDEQPTEDITTVLRLDDDPGFTPLASTDLPGTPRGIFAVQDEVVVMTKTSTTPKLEIRHYKPADL